MAKGGAKAAKPAPTRAMDCPACGTPNAVKAFPAACKVCATALPDPDAPLQPPARPAMWGRIDPPAAVPPGEGPNPLAIVALVAGILALVTLWVLPVCILFALTAAICGTVALAQGSNDGGGSGAMAGIGIGLGVLALLLMWWAFVVFEDDSGSSVYIDFDDGGSSEPADDGGSGGSSGGGSGGSGGASGGGGGSGAESGGSGGESVDAPAPAFLVAGLAALAAAAWRRRR